MSRIDRYLQELNEPQREAVLENSKPLLVLAGAGSGKTRVITTKIAYAIEVLGIRPWEILAVTFTNKAASEMRKRVTEMLPEVDVADMQIRTFHSFGAWLLRRYGSNIGLSNAFTIYDDEDSLSLLATCYPSHKKTELSPVAKAISLAKDMGLRPDSADLSDFRNDRGFAGQFAAYEEKLRRVGNVDFADLIGRSIEVLTGFPEVARQMHNRFKVILVDEYQDSNISQFNLLKFLVGPRNFICVVGDDDQSIYRFRGAEVRNILSFPDVYPGTRIIKLEQNYRSTGKILAIASEVIARNKGRHPKTLWTANGEGSDCRLVYVADEKTEALRCANIIKRKGNYDGAAILYRTNAQSVAFETLFSQMGIPYKVVGALRFYDREEVKDALALLFLMMNRSDIVSFRRMVNKPARGLGDVSEDRVISLATERKIDLIAALRQAVEAGLLAGKAASGALAFADLFDKADRMLETEGNSPCLKLLVTDSFLVDHYKKLDELNKTDKVDNLGTLISTVNDYPEGREGFLAFLESLMLDPTTIGRKDPSLEPGVTLITMHNTKGLEFDQVFITGMEEGLFPGRSAESDEDIEEERRIFYVAVTRARKELFLLCCQRRMIWGRTAYQIPSRFIDEISPEKLVVEGSRAGTSNDYSFGNPGQGGYGGYGALDEKRIRAGAYAAPSATAPSGQRAFGASREHKAAAPPPRNQNLFKVPVKPVTTVLAPRAVVIPSAGSGSFSVNLLAPRAVVIPQTGKSELSKPTTPNVPSTRSFKSGERVFHDSYGEGEVQSVRILRDRQLVDVRFRTGRTASFFSDVAPLEKLGSD